MVQERLHPGKMPRWSGNGQRNHPSV